MLTVKAFITLDCSNQLEAINIVALVNRHSTLIKKKKAIRNVME